MPKQESQMNKNFGPSGPCIIENLLANSNKAFWQKLYNNGLIWLYQFKATLPSVKSFLQNIMKHF